MYEQIIIVMFIVIKVNLTINVCIYTLGHIVLLDSDLSRHESIPHDLKWILVFFCQEIHLCFVITKIYFEFLKVFSVKLRSWKLVHMFLCDNEITKNLTQLERWADEKWRRRARDELMHCQESYRVHILSFCFLSFSWMPQCSLVSSAALFFWEPFLLWEECQVPISMRFSLFCIFFCYLWSTLDFLVFLLLLVFFASVFVCAVVSFSLYSIQDSITLLSTEGNCLWSSNTRNTVWNKDNNKHRMHFFKKIKIHVYKSNSAKNELVLRT